jgi:outer membrane protein assembly factor BamB
MFTRFLATLAACGLLILSFLGWWLIDGRRTWAERLRGLAAAVGGGAVAALFSGPLAMLMAWLLLSIPWVLTAWAAWLLAARWAPARLRPLGLAAVLLLAWSAFTLVRTDGLSGEGRLSLRPLWIASAEERYLADRARRRAGEAESPTSPALTLRAADWPGFRGPGRDGVVRGLRIATNWDAHPPREVWRQLVGPAWSSVVVVGERLFTQEQRGDVEAVVCLDVADGREVWAHEDPVRHEDGPSGAGPRATPTFADGRIYALGATGVLNCLDAAGGKRLWSHDIAADSGAKVPIWGFASSPLVVEGVVVVFAGGEGDKGLLAYRVDSGDLAWTAPAGRFSYSSPQTAALGRKKQILFLGDRGLTAFDPDSGAAVWEHGLPSRGLPWTLQPQPVGDGQFLIASEGTGTTLLTVGREGEGSAWTTAEQWTSAEMKPSFNDFVVYEDAVYGFNGGGLCCLDRETGERRWKGGRYEHGQVLLLADQGMLLVVSEGGKAVLVAARPDRHEELARFQAVTGKTWNHPAIADGRLYVRNAEEIACYELPRRDGP